MRRLKPQSSSPRRKRGNSCEEPLDAIWALRVLPPKPVRPGTMVQEEALSVTHEGSRNEVAGERAGADPGIDGCPEEVAAAIKSALGAGAISPERARLLLDTVKSRVEVDIAALTADRVAKIQGTLAAPRLNLMVTYQSSAIPRASAASRMPPKMPPDDERRIAARG